MMIRPYKKADKSKVLEIFQMNVPEFFDSKEVSEFESYLEKYSDTYLVLERESQIIGAFGYLVGDKAGQITWIFLNPEFSGHGYGKMAVNHCLSIFRTRNELETVELRTSQLAYKFFEKFGFQLIQTKKGYWGKGLDLYEMIYQLKGC